MVYRSKCEEENNTTPIFNFKYDQTNTFIENYDDQHIPIKICFGRPDFISILQSMVTSSVKDVYVYSTTPQSLNEILFDATIEATKRTGVKFHHIYESTS